MRETTTQGEPFLTDDMGGCHLVETAGGTSLRLDLDCRTVETFAANSRTPFSRRDGEAVDLVLLATCRVGDPMVLLLDLEVPGVWFTRRTTEPVIEIRAEAASAAGFPVR
jgi:hypothetical protein